MRIHHHILICGVAALSLCFLTACKSAQEGGDAHTKQRLRKLDPAGDFECEEDPGATDQPAAFDIREVDVVQSGDDIVVTITFDGDIEAYNEMTDEKVPIAVSFFFGSEYVEAFFSEKDKVKVADGKTSADFRFDGKKLIFTIRNRKISDILTMLVGAYVGGFNLGWTGLCIDEVPLDCEDEPTTGDAGNNVNENNRDPDAGEPDMDPHASFAYVLLEDKSPAVTRTDARPGSDIDRVEVCKQSTSSNCHMFDVVVDQAPDVINSNGLSTSGGADACENTTYVSLAGGFVIARLSDPTITIEPGDNIRAFGLGEFLCADAGPDTEQIYDVSVGTSEVRDTFKFVGECGAAVPCRHPIPNGF